MLRPLLIGLPLLFCLATCSAAGAAPPNIIYILADDLGYGDLSCYGQKTLQTPNLDRMAGEGLRFTRHYAGSTVCAPSRCVLMTGLHTGHCRIRGNGPGQLQKEDVTFATLLRKAGYKTAAFGKWGIGNPPPLDDPQRHGFDEFYGYINMFHAHNYYPEFLIHNGKKEPLKNRLYADWKEKRTGPREGAGVAEVAVDYAPAMIADAMLAFIRENHHQPFFVYYALNIPHANNEGGGEPRIDRNGLRVPDWGRFADKPWPIQEKGFARMIQRIDGDVGRILALLRELKIDDNTLVMFSSDNGPHQEGGHKVDFFDSNGPLRGHKRDLYEGGIRAPMIAWWPGKVSPGRTTDHISGFQDLFPTVAELAGVQDVPSTDGISLAPTLLGDHKNQRTHDHLYWEFHEQGGKRAVVQGNWKAVRLNVDRQQNGPLELYDLAGDEAETHNVAGDHPDIVARLAELMRRGHR
jgi:arylsulfatase A-like enzyme